MDLVPTNHISRPAVNGWAPGHYLCRCTTCNCEFLGEKRAFTCADCAYNTPVVAGYSGYSGGTTGLSGGKPVAIIDPASIFNVGDAVEKVGGDYTFEGTVVSVFSKLSGATRLVVEDNRGVLHIYSEKNLKRRST